MGHFVIGHPMAVSGCGPGSIHVMLIAFVHFNGHYKGRGNWLWPMGLWQHLLEPGRGPGHAIVR